MINKIIFDMDGTIADLYGVENWLAMLREENTFPYEVAEPMIDFNELNIVLKELKTQGWQIAIVSWLSKDSTKEYANRVRKAKREWLKRYEILVDEIHFVKYGTPKQRCVKGDVLILFDDNEQVRNNFTKTTGKSVRISINPAEYNIINYLQDLIS